MFPANLKTLFLDQNRIEKFAEVDLESLDQLVRQTGLELRLNKNPFLCDCKSRDLFHFIQNRKGVIDDAADVTIVCEQGNMKLLDTKLHEFCEPGLSPVLIAIVIIIVIVLLFVCSVLVFYSCHRQTIKVWIYSKSWARIFFSEDLIDKDKPYDAFLSYSPADAQFVEEVLLTGLEAPGNPEHKYKCLVPSRDWNIGEMIPEQIVQSVQTSRRTVIVISKAYIESMWSKLELRAAHTQAMEDKTQRVILIVIGQLPAPADMDSSLAKYLTMNTYLDSQDPWFWQKLRYALPHRGTFWKKKTRRLATDKIELIRSQVSVELGKDSRTPSPSAGEVRQSLGLPGRDMVEQIKSGESRVLQESGALARNNPHLHARPTNNLINAPTDENDSYFLI